MAIIGILKMISTHSIMDSTAVSGAAGSGSIPDGCISPSIICVFKFKSALIFRSQKCIGFLTSIIRKQSIKSSRLQLTYDQLIIDLICDGFL